MSELSHEQRLALSNEAKRLLEDTLFNAVVNAITKDYIQTLMQTAPGSPEGISAHAGLNALNDIKSQLRALENDGVIVRKQAAGNSAHPG